MGVAGIAKAAYSSSAAAFEKTAAAEDTHWVAGNPPVRLDEEEEEDNSRAVTLEGGAGYTGGILEASRTVAGTSPVASIRTEKGQVGEAAASGAEVGKMMIQPRILRERSRNASPNSLPEYRLQTIDRL